MFGEDWIEDFEMKYGNGSVTRDSPVRGLDPVRETVGSNVTEPSLGRWSKPTGNYSVPDANNPKPLTGQNKAADLLASDGMNVEMLDEVPGGNGYGITKSSNPDYLIEQKPADCYTPQKNSLSTIRDTIKDKTQRQASTIVVNLDDVNISQESLLNYIQKHPVNGLDEIYIIKGNKYIQYKP